MIAKATVYLDASRTRAVSADDPKGQFLLVRQGSEISQAHAERYPGAVELIGGTKEAPRGVQAQTPAVQTRDPEAAKGSRAGKG